MRNELVQFTVVPPPKEKPPKIWAHRFEDINNFEQYLVRNGIVVLKFFLNLSKEEQRARLVARIDEPEKHWKFSLGDITQRAHWDEYIAAYEHAIARCSTEAAPWHIIPADRKWYRNWAVSSLLIERLEAMGLDWPKPGYDVKAERTKLVTMP